MLKNTIKNLVTVRVFRLEQVFQRACGVTIVGNIQNLTAHRPGQLAVADLFLNRRVGLDDLRRSFPVLTSLRFYYVKVILYFK